jgi:hypothetical protein
MGTMDECHIHGESHMVMSNDNTYRVIVPELAPFFKHDFKIIHADSQVELNEGSDFNFAWELKDARRIAGRKLFGGISIINPELKGEFILDYRTVGHTFVGIRSDVLTRLANVLTDPVKTPYERLLDRPMTFTPHRHKQHYADFVNKEGVEASIDGITQAVKEAMDTSDVEAVDYLNSRIDQVHSILDQYDFAGHIANKANPHKVSYTQADALPEDGRAASAMQAYTLTLLELAEYINSRGITQDDIDRYLEKATNQTIHDDFTLDGGTLSIKSSSGTSKVSLDNGNIEYTSDGLTAVYADDDASGNANVTMQAGNNVLEIVSTGNNYQYDTIKYNGHQLLHVENVREMLKKLGGTGMRVVSENTDTVDITGSSRPDNKLEAHAKYVTATLTKRGVIKLSDDPDSKSIATAPTPKVLYMLRERLGGRVKDSQTINGYPIRDGMSFDKTDIYLDKVDNTADKDKPISIKQQEYLDQFSKKGHVHDLKDMDMDVADEDTWGIFRIADDIEEVKTGSTAASPYVITQIDEQISNAEDSLRGLMPASAIDLSYWSAPSGIPYTGFTFEIGSDCVFYKNEIMYSDSETEMPSKTFDLKALYPKNHVNNIFYVYINVIGGSLTYTVDVTLYPNNSSRMHVLTIETDDQGIIWTTSSVGDEARPLSTPVLEGSRFDLQPFRWGPVVFKTVVDTTGVDECVITSKVDDTTYVYIDGNPQPVRYGFYSDPYVVSTPRDTMTLAAICVDSGRGGYNALLKVEDKDGNVLAKPDTTNWDLYVFKDRDGYPYDESNPLPEPGNTEYWGSIDRVARSNYHGRNLLVPEPVTSVGEFRELEEHKTDPQAHMNSDAGDMGDPSTIGLGLVKNEQAVNHVDDGSHNGFRKWVMAHNFNEVNVTENRYIQSGVNLNDGVSVELKGTSNDNHYFAAASPTMNFMDPTFINEEGERLVSWKITAPMSGDNAIRDVGAVIGKYVDEDDNIYFVIARIDCRDTDNKHYFQILLIDETGDIVTVIKSYIVKSIEINTAATFYVTIRYRLDGGVPAYNIDIQTDAVQDRKLYQYIADMVFAPDAIKMKYTVNYYNGSKEQIYNSGREEVGYGSGIVKNAIDGGNVGIVTRPRGGNDALSFTVDCIGSDIGGLRDKYVTAEGVYMSIRDGSNLPVVKGYVDTSKSGLLPLPKGCRRYIAYYGIRRWGNKSNKNNPIDGVRMGLKSYLSGKEMTGNIDMTSPDRHIVADCYYKREKDGAGGDITQPMLVNFLLIGVRDI